MLCYSKTISKSDKVCVNFWYNLFGSTIGTLNVYTRIRKQLSTEPIWSISGEQGKLWRPAAVPIREFEDFQVVFEATNGNGVRGDLAIDVIVFVIVDN